VLAGFNGAYNARRQRVLKGRSPEMVLRERLTAKPELANPLAKPPDPEILPSALRVVADAKEVSHPDTCLLAFGILAFFGFGGEALLRLLRVGLPAFRRRIPALHHRL
jgi:hypothetical protein